MDFKPNSTKKKTTCRTRFASTYILWIDLISSWCEISNIPSHQGIYILIVGLDNGCSDSRWNNWPNKQQISLG